MLCCGVCRVMQMVTDTTPCPVSFAAAHPRSCLLGFLHREGVGIYGMPLTLCGDGPGEGTLREGRSQALTREGPCATPPLS